MTGIMQRGDVEAVPGLSIGEVSLGFSRADVLSVLGPPAQIDNSQSQEGEQVSWRYRHGLYELRFDMPMDRLVEITTRHRLVALNGQRLLGPRGLSSGQLSPEQVAAWEQAGLRVEMGASGPDAVSVFVGAAAAEDQPQAEAP